MEDASDNGGTTPGRLWWQDGVIYQIYPLSYADSNDDGIGDLPGVLAHLDYLNDGTPNSLGIDAIWLSPVYPSPWRDFGYDVSDYCDIHPSMGSLAVFDELVAAAHQRGIRIILDLVLNHSSDQHDWFKQSRSSRDNPKRDWYIWHDGKGQSEPPNNWLSSFGGTAWTWDRATAQWYMHGFLAEQPELNWRNDDTRAALMDVMHFWLDRGVDGFRLDVVNHYYKDAQFRDNPPTKGWHINPYFRQQHVYDKDQPEVIPALQEMRRILESYSERMMVGEIYSDHAIQTSAATYGPHNDALNMAFNFAFTLSRWDPAAFQRVILAWEEALPEGAWPCYTLSNHDQHRHFSRYAKGNESSQRAKVAIAMLLTLRGTPFIYYGEEIGMSQTPIPRSRLKDPVGRRFYPLNKGRDGARTPMQWDASANAGFSDADPWLPINEDYPTCNVAVEEDDPRSLLHFYRKLIWLRKAIPALKSGSFVPLQDDPKDALSFLRQSDNQTIWVMLNFKNRSIRFVPDKALPSRHWKVIFSTAGRSGIEQPGLAPVFAPYEVCILEATHQSAHGDNTGDGGSSAT